MKWKHVLVEQRLDPPAEAEDPTVAVKVFYCPKMTREAH